HLTHPVTLLVSFRKRLACETQTVARVSLHFLHRGLKRRLTVAIGLRRCARRVSTTVTRLDLRTLDVKGDVRRVDCADGGHFIDVTLNDEVVDVNDTHDDRTEDGWREVRTDRDKVLYYMLSQVVYPDTDAPRPERFESLYALADKLDVVSLRWQGGRAVGFYTVKFAGTKASSTGQGCGMPVVDTAYIRSEYRSRGFGTEILSDMTARFPNEDIGFSRPISSGMLRILKRFLTSQREYRLHFWEISDCADIVGSQQLIWCRVKRAVL
ncbi:PREDICTED: soluble lamin-associated protein of 75 kDa-like, partial [Dinoponera quadriceps]|uniref:Soluble lamin-associated protein of 75 kDa-like n=1 Tax=Dinoponera quadriceps TaxID=609295 RepID=A0A6P3XC48_DINQU